MKKVNWKILNAALWAQVLLSYLMPFRTDDHFAYQLGFPFSFLTIYDGTPLGVNALSSMHVNLGALLLNAVVLYVLIQYAVQGYHKLKSRNHAAAQPHVQREKVQ